jgi:hypothetical protein
MLKRIAWIIALGAPMVWGCSAEMRAEPAARDLAGAICDLGFRCCNTGEMDYYMSPFVGDDDCAERLVSSASTSTSTSFSVPIAGGSIALPNVHALDRAIKDERVRVNEGALRECVAFLQELSCNTEPEDPEDPDDEACDPTLPEPPEGPSPCSLSELVVGRVGSGGRCTSPLMGLECRDDLVCLRATGSLGVDGACGAPQQLGEPCFADGECADDLHCSLVDGTCQEFRQAGESCIFAETEEPVPSPSTLLLRCAPGLTCSPFEQVCVGPCSRGYDCSTDADCQEGMTCASRVDSRGSWRSHCDAPHPEAGPCRFASDCVEGLTCEGSATFPPTEGECTPALADGAACFFDGECQSGICSNASGSCTSPRANGLACARDLECQSEYCDLFFGECAPMANPGEECASGLDRECADGWCNTPDFFSPSACTGENEEEVCDSNTCSDPVSGFCLECVVDEDCNTGLCDTDTNQCLNVCVALLDDGETCSAHADCASGVCVPDANVCGTPPFADGSPCASDDQCESEFCNFGALPPVCATPPLANGQPCYLSSHCESRVCFEGSCQNGAGAGTECGPGLRPCDPATFFCDLEAANPQCTLIRETGEDCTRDAECRSNFCTIEWGRPMCYPADPLDGLICDGA